MENFESSGVVLFSGRNVIKSMVVDGQDVVVKRFRRPNFFQKIAYTFFCKTKAYKAFHNAKTLIERGFSTPVPIRYIETFRFGLVDYCYFISGHDDDPPIEQLLDRDDWDRELATHFARFVADLHARGVLHHDLNDTNVRYSTDFRFSLIDINRMKFYPLGQDIPLRECLDNLTRFTGRMDLFEYVVREYSRTRKLDEQQTTRLALDIKTVHDRNWYRRKRFTGALKRLKFIG